MRCASAFAKTSRETAAPIPFPWCSRQNVKVVQEPVVFLWAK